MSSSYLYVTERYADVSYVLFHNLARCLGWSAAVLLLVVCVSQIEH